MLMLGSAAAANAVHMSLASIHSLALWQQDSINSGNSKLLMIFVGIAATALITQAIVMVAFAVIAAKAQKALMVHVEELKGKILPFVDNTHTLVKDLTPEVKKITTNLHTLITDLTPDVKEITAKVNTLVSDLSPEIKQITTTVHGITVKVEEISGHLEEIVSVAKDKVHEFSPTISAANVTLMEANETVRAVNQRSREQVERVNVIVTGAIEATVNAGAAIGHAITQPVKDVADMLSSAKDSVVSVAQGARKSVDSMSEGTKNFLGSLLHGAKGLVEAYTAPKKKKQPKYEPASYAYNPAEPTPPTKHVETGEVPWEPRL